MINVPSPFSMTELACNRESRLRIRSTSAQYRGSSPIKTTWSRTLSFLIPTCPLLNKSGSDSELKKLITWQHDFVKHQ